MRAFHLRVTYLDPICADCGATNHEPICICGYIRPGTDEFCIVVGRRRVQLARYQQFQIRNALRE